MAEMGPNDYQLVRIALLAGISARAAELGEEILTEAEDTIDDLRRENAALREALDNGNKRFLDNGNKRFTEALAHANKESLRARYDFHDESQHDVWCGRAEGYATVIAWLSTIPAAVPADARGERERALIDAAKEWACHEEMVRDHERSGRIILTTEYNDKLLAAVDALDAPPAGREEGA